MQAIQWCMLLFAQTTAFKITHTVSLGRNLHWITYLLQGIATDTSVFETVVISDSGIPVEDAKKIGITYFPAGGTTVYMQGVDIHACVGKLIYVLIYRFDDKSMVN